MRNSQSSDGLVAHIAAMSRNQIGARLLASLARRPDIARPIFEATSSEPVGEATLARVGELCRRARRTAMLEKVVGMFWLAVAMLLIAAALLWPVLEKSLFKLSESIFTGLGQAALTLLGTWAGSRYLKAKRVQSGIEDALRRLLFEHAPADQRIAFAEAVLDGSAPRAGSGAASVPVRFDFRNVRDVNEAFAVAIGRDLTDGEALAIAAQLKEASIKYFAWTAAAGTTLAAAIGLFLLAIVLPFAAHRWPGYLEGEIADALQPIIGVAMPAFLLALRREALQKRGELAAAVSAMLTLPEPLDAKAARGLAALDSIDKGLSTFVEQMPVSGGKPNE